MSNGYKMKSIIGYLIICGKKWSSTVRRHGLTKSNTADTLQTQLSGYGTKAIIIQKVLDRLKLKEPIELETWDESMLHTFVDTFLEERFPTVLVLNKIDMPESDKNIAKICKKYPDANMVLSSALAENFLRKMQKQGFIRYKEGSDNFKTLEEEEQEKTEQDRPSDLKPLDDKNKARLEKLKI